MRVVQFDLSPDEMALMQRIHALRTEFSKAYGIDPQPDAVRSMLQTALEWAVMVENFGGPQALAQHCLRTAHESDGTKH